MNKNSLHTLRRTHFTSPASFIAIWSLQVYFLDCQWFWGLMVHPVLILYNPCIWKGSCEKNRILPTENQRIEFTQASLLQLLFWDPSPLKCERHIRNPPRTTRWRIKSDERRYCAVPVGRSENFAPIGSLLSSLLSLPTWRLETWIYRQDWPRRNSLLLGDTVGCGCHDINH